VHRSQTVALQGIVIAVLSASPLSLPAEAGPVVLRAGDLAASFSLDEGRVISLAVRGHELLVAPGGLTLQVDRAAPVSVGKGFEGLAVSKRERGLTIEGREPRSGVAIRAEWLAGKDLQCRITLAGRKSPRSEAAVELLLPCASRPLEVLAPGPADRHTADDAPWKVVHQYVTGKRPPNVSVAKVNDYIRRLHAQGIHAIMYFNPTEAWKLWITANYPEALALDPGGKSYPTWYESYMVCPNPESAWGKHLLNEFEKMMDLYPEADGFFMDQSCYDHLDYAHDDGWSIENGRTGYRMGWAINQLSRRCREMAKARGKFLWWNGPYSSDIARFAEGMMAEAGDEGEVKCIQYLTMGGRACCTLSQKGETTFQNCAAYGLYPTAMPQPLVRLATRYWPIFDLFRGKRWVLSAHALELPAGTKGNIWQLPDGSALASVVTAGRSVDGAAFDVNVPLTVRLPGAAGYRAAYFLSPDLAGKRKLPIQRDGETLCLTIPRHRSASAVLLAKTGVHLALEGPVGAVVDRGVDVTAIVDNWTDKPVAGRWTSPAWKDDPLEVQPDQSVRRAFRYQAPAKRGGLREAVTCRADVAGGVLGGDLEFYIDEPLSVSAFKIGRFRLQLRLKDGVRVLSEINPGVFSSLPGWIWNEGRIFENGKLRTDIHVPGDTTSAAE
jgi:hypothetical protein